MKRLAILSGLLIIYSSYTQDLPIDKGPADESAYWILKINGKLQPYTVVYPYKLNFKQIKVGDEATAQVKILNKGYGSLTIEKISLKKGNNFAIYGTTCTKPLEFGQSCEVTVAFKPTEPGKHSDVLFIETNDPSNKVITIPLSGTAASAVIEKPQILPPPLPISKPQKIKKNKKEKVEKPKKLKEKTINPKVKVWVVKPCDTLWDISSSVYGTPLLWSAIYEANKDKIVDPWMLTVGWKLKIPVLTAKEAKKYKKETLRLMEEMADRPLGPKCP